MEKGYERGKLKIWDILPPVGGNKKSLVAVWTTGLLTDFTVGVMLFSVPLPYGH